MNNFRDAFSVDYLLKNRNNYFGDISKIDELSLANIENVNKNIERIQETPDANLETILPSISKNNINEALSSTGFNTEIQYEEFHKLFEKIINFFIGSKNLKIEDLYNSLLIDFYEINKLILNKEFLNIKLKQHFANFILKIIATLHLSVLSNNAEILVYTLFGSFEKKFKKEESDFKKIQDDFWNLLIPIAIKQEQLLFIKVTEFWYLLGENFELLKTIMIDILENKILIKDDYERN